MYMNGERDKCYIYTNCNLLLTCGINWAYVVNVQTVKKNMNLICFGTHFYVEIKLTCVCYISQCNCHLYTDQNSTKNQHRPQLPLCATKLYCIKEGHPHGNRSLSRLKPIYTLHIHIGLMVRVL